MRSFLDLLEGKTLRIEGEYHYYPLTESGRIVCALSHQDGLPTFKGTRMTLATLLYQARRIETEGTSRMAFEAAFGYRYPWAVYCEARELAAEAGYLYFSRPPFAADMTWEEQDTLPFPEAFMERYGLSLEDVCERNWCLTKKRPGPLRRRADGVGWEPAEGENPSAPEGQRRTE